MPNLQAVKTKTKQPFQTDKVQNQILENLTLEEVLEFIQELSKKTLEKKKAQDLKVQNTTLPPHIRKGIGESLEAYKKGKFVTLNTKTELLDHFEKLSH